MKKMQRRNFLKQTSLAAAAIGTGMISGCSSENKNESPAVISDKKYEWKMVTAWPPNFPILGELAKKMAEWIESMSGGRMKIQVYAGGELIPPLETFDAVSQGVAEMSHSVAYYWAGKIPAAQFFTSVPFGMNTQQFNSWMYTGGGKELWEDLYKPHNLVPILAGNTGGQMGGWFNKEINSMADMRGLKIRMPGLGGKVITKAGASAMLAPGQELYTNLERGVLDALEWVGPYHDYVWGFQRIAKYYYYPAWQEPTGAIELSINKKAFDSLPDDLKQIIRTAANASNTIMLSQFESKNAEYLQKIKDEEKVQIKEFPQEVLEAFRRLTSDVINEIAGKDSQARKVYNSYRAFHKQISVWNQISERNYL